MSRALRYIGLSSTVIAVPVVAFVAATLAYRPYHWGCRVDGCGQLRIYSNVRCVDGGYDHRMQCRGKVYGVLRDERD